MKCSNCETENLENAVYCQQCGTYLDTHKTSEFIGVTGFILGTMSIVGMSLGIVSIFLLISLATGVYLYKIEDEIPKKRGKFLIFASVGIWIIAIGIVIITKLAGL